MCLAPKTLVLKDKVPVHPGIAELDSSIYSEPVEAERN